MQRTKSTSRSGRDNGDSSLLSGDDAVTLLSMLADADARQILAATSTRPCTVNEIVETCGIPTPTAYRKVDTLETCGLLVERIRIRSSGRHASEYLRCVRNVQVDVPAGPGSAVSVRVVHGTVEERSLQGPNVQEWQGPPNAYSLESDVTFR